MGEHRDEVSGCGDRRRRPGERLAAAVTRSGRGGQRLVTSVNVSENPSTAGEPPVDTAA